MEKLTSEEKVALMRYENYLKNRIGVNPAENNIKGMFLENYKSFLDKNFGNFYSHQQMKSLSFLNKI